jgi:formate-dependent nitrite reductase membrane component NrfD
VSERPVVPRAEPRSYYGQPVVKEPVWTWEIPLYFFTGGVAGASAGLAWGAELRGNRRLARRAWQVSLAGVAVSPALLVSDLGRPARFLNMFRMLRVTSPMSVGSWVLGATGAAVGAAALDAHTGAVPGGRAARAAAALLGLPLCTYTGALVGNTSVPVWHEARHTLPFLFAAGAAASAGAAATATLPPRDSAPARRLAIGGAAVELVVAHAMEQRLGELAAPYRHGAPGALSKAATGLTLGGAALLARAGGRDRAAAAAGGALVLAGALAERFSVFRAGFASARDPRFTVGPQRERVARGASRGAERQPAAAA